MTVNVEIPQNTLVGNGTITTFPFTFGIIETFDLLVLVREVGGLYVLQVEFSAYTIENRTGIGGDIEFVTAPDSGAEVLILRRTTMTQQVDYITGEPFQSETHEGQMDKTIYILQELMTGAFSGVDSNGDPVYLTFDLSVTAGVTTVTINNSGGTDAVLQPWVSGTLAGVYHAEVLAEGSVPADESATSEEDGHIWLGI